MAKSVLTVAHAGGRVDRDQALRRLVRGAVATVLVLGLVACGSDDDDDPAGATADSTSAATADSTSAATADSTSAATADSTSSAATADSAPSAATDVAGSVAGSDPARDGAGGDCPEDRVGGVLTVAQATNLPGLDPIAVPGRSSTGGTEFTAIYDTLMRWNFADRTFEPFVAESLESNADLTEWTLTLREGMAFSDGTPFDGAAVVSAIERMKSEDAVSNARQLVRHITDMTVVDAQTVVLSTPDGFGGMNYLLATEAGMVTNPNVSAEQLATSPPEHAGIGPFVVSSFDSTSELVLERREDYWRGRPCLDGLRFIWIADGNTALEALQSGDVDGMWTRDPLVGSHVREAGFDGPANTAHMASAFMVNAGFEDSGDRITHDPRVRKALVQAVDVEQFNDRVWQGTALAHKTVVHPDNRLSPGAGGVEFDPEAARALVEEVEADTGWDGSIGVLCAQSGTEWAVTLEAMLEGVGFDVEVEMAPDAREVIRRVAVEHSFDIACLGAATDDSYLAGNLAVAELYGGYTSPEFDAVLADARLAVTDDDVREVAGELQEVFDKDNPFIILASQQEFSAFRAGVEGLWLTRDGVVMFNDASVQ